MRHDTLKIAALVSAMVAMAALAGTSEGQAMERSAGLQNRDFATLDADGDGEITVSDLDTRRAAQFDNIDNDGDGVITQEEFIAAASARASERAVTLFSRLDADGDGVITRDTLEASAGTARRGVRMLERADRNGSGGVDAEEFATALERMRNRMGMRNGEGTR